MNWNLQRCFVYARDNSWGLRCTMMGRHQKGRWIYKRWDEFTSPPTSSLAVICQQPTKRLVQPMEAEKHQLHSPWKEWDHLMDGGGDGISFDRIRVRAHAQLDGKAESGAVAGEKKRKRNWYSRRRWEMGRKRRNQIEAEWERPCLVCNSLVGQFYRVFAETHQWPVAFSNYPAFILLSEISYSF